MAEEKTEGMNELEERADAFPDYLTRDTKGMYGTELPEDIQEALQAFQASLDNEELKQALEKALKGEEKTSCFVPLNENVGLGVLVDERYYEYEFDEFDEDDIDKDMVVWIGQMPENGGDGEAIPLFMDGNVVPNPPVYNLSYWTLGRPEDILVSYMEEVSCKGRAIPTKEKGAWPLPATAMVLEALTVANKLDEKAWSMTCYGLSDAVKRTRNSNIVDRIKSGPHAESHVTGDLSLLSWHMEDDLVVALANEDGSLESGLINFSAMAKRKERDAKEMMEELKDFIVKHHERLGFNCCDEFFNAPRPRIPELAEEGYFWNYFENRSLSLFDQREYELVDGNDKTVATFFEKINDDPFDGPFGHNFYGEMAGIKFDVIIPPKTSDELVFRLAEEMAAEGPDERKDLFRKGMSEILGVEDVPVEEAHETRDPSPSKDGPGLE